MRDASAALLALSALAVLAGCASSSGLDSRPCAPASCGAALDGDGARIPCVPAFSADGRLRRDVTTDAPMFVAEPQALRAVAPRFNDDGSVCRDPETGAPLFDDVAGGRVVRVLVVPR